MEPARADKFFGTERFTVERRLGEGHFGVVYQVLDRQRGTRVALKTLREGNVEALFRLKREFRALADIRHRNLVRYHELLAHGDQWFFTMELVEGVNFLQYVRGEHAAVPAPPDAPTTPASALPPEAGHETASRHAGRLDRIRAALRQAVEGIQALHRAGQIHRDIKPSNVLVTRGGAARPARLRAGHRSEPVRLQAQPLDRRNPGLHVAGARIGAGRVAMRRTGTASA